MKLCDTSVVVDIDRGGVDERVQILDEQGTHGISMVTVTELRLGVELGYEHESDAYREAMDGLDRLCSRFKVYPITRPIATTAATLIATLRARGQRLDDLHDVYIAATARVQQLSVLTANVDHFERMDDVPVTDWSDL